MEASKLDKVEKSEILDHEEVKSKGITYNTIGTTLQALSVQLDENEIILSEAGKMSWMTNNISLKTRGQGIGKMFSRIIASESIFINEFTSTSGTGVVTFSTDQAGKIIPVDLDESKPGIIFQRGSYLCSEQGIDRSTVFIKKLSAGFFGGKGFILQKLSGVGRSHLIADGEVVLYELKEGETILVDQGNLVAYEESVDFDIRTVGGGVKNWLFGGEGLFLGSLTGPGKVWLQSRKITVTGSAARKAAGQYNRGGGASNPLGCIIGLAITMCTLVTIIMASFIGSL